MAGKTWKKTKVQFLWQHRKYGTYYARFHRDGKQHRKSLKTDVFGSPKRRSPHTSKTFDPMRWPPKPYPTICVGESSINGTVCREPEREAWLQTSEHWHGTNGAGLF
jgi:hypothetical protein